jgi:LCP family protein required for cell wall assembly
LNSTAARKRKELTESSQYPLWLRVLIPLFLVILLLGGICSGFVLYVTLRSLVANVDLPAFPEIRLPVFGGAKVLANADPDEPLPKMGNPTPQVGAGDQAIVAPAESMTTGDRINILLLGVDRRKADNWNHLTDTIIIVTVDPANKTVGMLSIPRDLQVPIPGYGEDRINTANVKGESGDYPGGGPALLKRTIEANFGIPIDYYVMVDFKGFAKIIDTLGGVDIDVPKVIHDTKYPDPLPLDPYHYKTIHFDPGPQHMDGTRALEYARSRMSTTDFDRAKRQQDILVAIRNKALNLNLIPKLPSLAGTMMDAVKTDMSLEEMLDLATLAPQVDMANLRQVVLEKPYVYGYKRPSDGAAVQLPKWDLIDPVIDDLFSTPLVVATPAPTLPPPTPTPTPAPVNTEELEQLAREGARIAVQNGTTEPNYAARVAAMLMEKGYQVVEFGDADRVDYPSTVIVDYSGKAYTLSRLVDLFGVTPENVRHSPNLLSQIDARIIVGQDFLQTFR